MNTVWKRVAVVGHAPKPACTKTTTNKSIKKFVIWCNFLVRQKLFRCYAKNHRDEDETFLDWNMVQRARTLGKLFSSQMCRDSTQKIIHNFCPLSSSIVVCALHYIFSICWMFKRVGRFVGRIFVVKINERCVLHKKS